VFLWRGRAIGIFYSLILPPCSSRLWPDHRSVASFAHERLLYRRRAARQRTKRCTDSSRSSFCVYPSVCGGDPSASHIRIEDVGPAADDFQARDASLPGWNGRMMSESAWQVKKEENWARLGRAQVHVFAISSGNFSLTFEEIVKQRNFC